MNPQDNPLFTAYALGELSAEEARELHEMLAATPAAAHELEQIEAVTDALRHGAPIPQDRLTHEQRHAVLHPSGLPRRIQPMMPRQPARPRANTLWPVMGPMLKAAAVVALSGGAFLAGWSFSTVVKQAASLASAPEGSKPAAPAGAAVPETGAAEPKGKNSGLVAEAPAPAAAALPQPQAPAALAPGLSPSKPEPVAAKPVKKEVVVAAVPAAALAPTPAPAATAPAVAAAPRAPARTPAPPPLNLGFTLADGKGAFASTTKQAADHFGLRPGLVRPVPPKAKGEAFASPQAQAAKPEPKQQARPAELYIHSWQSEVAACPWNAGHRLLRVVIQLPADQSAVLGPDAAFPLQISFDAANVKQYRMLCERHVAAAELRSAGTHVLWYEFQPNGDSAAPRDRLIATVTLPGVRFTSQTVGPFDSSKLQVIDRGYSLQNARDDFVFEAAVVGFGMLLRGTEQTGALDHALVLGLAKRAQGSGAAPERTRFIRIVEDAQRMAGL